MCFIFGHKSPYDSGFGGRHGVQHHTAMRSAFYHQLHMYRVYRSHQKQGLPEIWTIYTMSTPGEKYLLPKDDPDPGPTLLSSCLADKGRRDPKPVGAPQMSQAKSSVVIWCDHKVSGYVQVHGISRYSAAAHQSQRIVHLQHPNSEDATGIEFCQRDWHVDGKKPPSGVKKIPDIPDQISRSRCDRTS